MKGLRNNFLTKLLNWEYWPFELLYFPVSVYWVWCSIRAGSPFYFIAANPGIKNGGMLHDPKYPILQSFEKDKIPVTGLIEFGLSFDSMIKNMKQLALSFPVIVKPDIGERGLKVALLENEDQLKTYHEHAKFDYLIQEYITLPLEVGVFYIRYPNQKHGQITSVVVKEMLQVTGDGSSTLAELIHDYPRARLQWDSLKERFATSLSSIPDKGKVLELESIGNHNRGTTFLDGTDLIDEDLRKVVEGLALQVPGFYYGRFDLKCESMKAFKAGETIKILELNGAKSEPAHIYQPGFPLFKAYKSIFRHWTILFKISAMNHKKGVSYMKPLTCYKVFKEYKAYLKMVKSA